MAIRATRPIKTVSMRTFGALVVLVMAAGLLILVSGPSGVSASFAAPGSLPHVVEGPRPGPTVLYERLPQVPELSVRAPFRAEPLLVSGTDAYCDGEYLYQDYLFDDHGANTTASLLNGGEFGIFPPAGDVRYPTDKRFARNAADLVEFRVRRTSDALVYRITLNTVLEPEVAAVGIGIDADRTDRATVAWPHGAGVKSSGLDAFITAWGTGGEVALRPSGSSVLRVRRPLPEGSVWIDRERNQMTIRVPRTVIDPGRRTWRYVSGVGLWNGRSFTRVQTAAEPTATAPASGNDRRSAPAIFNLGFRFDEKQGQGSADTALGNGNWFEEGQANALAARTSGGFFADVDFAKIRRAGCRSLHAPGRDQARILASRLDVPEGVHSGAAPNFGGRLQPYMIHLPPPASQPPGLTLALHGNTATYTQWAAVSPRYMAQIGDERNSLVVAPLGRSTQGSGMAYDFFEVWADVAHHFAVDSERVALSGYSAGGYHTFVLGIEFPDLFGRAFAIVGAARLFNGGVPGDSTNFIPMIGNVRWVPYIAWNQAVDELAPYVGIRAGQAKFEELGLRSQVWTFPVGEHFTPGLLDQWVGASEFLGDARVTRDPSRVDYAIAPETWERLSPEYGPDHRYAKAHLVADHAYWISDLRVRDQVRDETNTVRGYITAISRVFGEGDPVREKVVGVYPGPPSPATIDGTDWQDIPRVKRRNALELRLRNLGRATVWGRRARLDPRSSLTVQISSDGHASVRLVLPFARGTNVVSVGKAARAGHVSVGRGEITFRVRAGSSTFVINPPSRAGAPRIAPQPSTTT